MLGLAIIGSQFDAYDPKFYLSYGQALSLLLMSNRFILAVQHGMSSELPHDDKLLTECKAVVALLARNVSDLARPAIILAIGYLLTGSIYLGISFIFPRGGPPAVQAGTAWYVLALGEAFFQSLAMRLYGGLSFTDTHLVERMGLLTLIVLGEGVIGLLEAVTSIWTSSVDGLYTAFISTASCATLILVRPQS